MLYKTCVCGVQVRIRAHQSVGLGDGNFGPEVADGERDCLAKEAV